MSATRVAGVGSSQSAVGPTLPFRLAPHSGRPSCFGDAPKAVIAGRLETAQFGHASVSSPMRILQKWQRQDGLKG